MTVAVDRSHTREKIKTTMVDKYSVGENKDVNVDEALYMVVTEWENLYQQWETRLRALYTSGGNASSSMTLSHFFFVRPDPRSSGGLRGGLSCL